MKLSKKEKLIRYEAVVEVLTTLKEEAHKKILQTPITNIDGYVKVLVAQRDYSIYNDLLKGLKGETYGK